MVCSNGNHTFTLLFGYCCTVLRMQACNVIEVKCNVTLTIGEGGIFYPESQDEISPFSRVNGD